jgi:hypothetical protein
MAHIQNNLDRRLPLALQKNIDQQPIDSGVVENDFLVALLLALFLRPSFHPVQRALACQRLALITGSPPIFPLGIILVCQHRQQRIASHLVVLVQVFVPSARPDTRLPHQLRHRMFHLPGFPNIGITIGKLADNAGPLFDRAQHQAPSITAHGSAVEFPSNFTLI